MSAPWKKHVAVIGMNDPRDSVKQSALAGAVGSEDRDHHPFVHGEGDPVKSLDRAVARDEAVDNQHVLGHRAALAVDQFARGTEVHLAPVDSKVGGDDLLVLLDVLRDAAGDELAVVEAVHLVGDVHDQIDVVLDQEDGHARIPDRLDPRYQVLPLARVHTRGRLVKQQELGLRCQSAGDLDQTLLTVREAGGGQHGLVFEAHQLQRIHGPRAGPLLFPPLRRAIPDRRPRSPTSRAGDSPPGRSPARSCSRRCAGSGRCGPFPHGPRWPGPASSTRCHRTIRGRWSSPGAG